MSSMLGLEIPFILSATLTVYPLVSFLKIAFSNLQHSSTVHFGQSAGSRLEVVKLVHGQEQTGH